MKQKKATKQNKVEQPKLGIKRTFSQTKESEDSQRHDSKKMRQEKTEAEYVFTEDYKVGDCLQSDHNSDLEKGADGEDQDQFDIIQEQIKQRMNLITDLKTLNQVQQMADQQILNQDIDEFEQMTKPKEESEHSQAQQTTKQDDDSDQSDDFECDIEKYVPFADKINLAELLKTCSKEALTEVVKLMQELQPQAIDDYGNSRV